MRGPLVLPEAARCSSIAILSSLVACGGATSLDETLAPVDLGEAAPGADVAHADAAGIDARVPRGDAVEPLTNNPFVVGEFWNGTTSCSPGGLAKIGLQVLAVTGDTIDDAIFWFDSAPFGTVGSYHPSGNFDPSTDAAVFTAGAWIDDPGGFTRVGLAGRVTLDSLPVTYSARPTHRTCSTISLTRAP